VTGGAGKLTSEGLKDLVLFRAATGGKGRAQRLCIPKKESLSIGEGAGGRKMGVGQRHKKGVDIAVHPELAYK